MVRVALINLAIAAVAVPAALAAPTYGGEKGHSWWRQGQVSNEDWKKWWSGAVEGWSSQWQRPTGTVTYVFPHTTVTRTYGHLPSSLIVSSSAEATFTEAPVPTETSAPTEPSVGSAPVTSASESTAAPESSVTSAPSSPASSSEAPAFTFSASRPGAPSSSSQAPAYTFSASRPGAPTYTASLPAVTSTTAAPATTSTAAAPSSTSSAAAPAGTLGAVQQEWLDQHNKVRAAHGAVALTWSSTLETAAKKWSDNCVWDHSQGKVGAYGENLFLGSGNSYTATDAVTNWAAEAKDYNPASPTYSHFTQVVWKGTTELGCAITTCDNIKEGWGPSSFMVCEYSKPGNVIGQFAENVQA